jgi:hypothetical protein
MIGPCYIIIAHAKSEPKEPTRIQQVTTYRVLKFEDRCYPSCRLSNQLDSKPLKRVQKSMEHDGLVISKQAGVAPFFSVLFVRCQRCQ